MSEEALERLINQICSLDEEQRESLRRNISRALMARGTNFRTIDLYIWLILMMV